MFACCSTIPAEPETDNCPLHPNYHLEKICVENSCLEPLCKICQMQHINTHKMLSTQPKLMNSDIVKHYALEQCQKQIRLLTSIPDIDYNKSAKDQLKEMINEFFYGNKNQRLTILRVREQVLLNKPKVANVISILIDEHRFMVPKNFDSCLASFLDKTITFHDI